LKKANSPLGLVPGFFGMGGLSSIGGPKSKQISTQIGALERAISRLPLPTLRIFGMIAPHDH
jgi:hypothetical protein